jgi:hypothetical protein
MAEYQITYWRDLPSLVVAREADSVTKSPLPPRFQEAIDEAAMRLGETGSDAYLAGWRRSDWTTVDTSPADAADAAVADLEAQWTPESIARYLASLGTVPEATS